MKKTLILFVLVIILGVAAWRIVQHNPSQTASYDINSSAFAIEDESTVQRIFIADKSGHTIDLKKERTGWRLNDKYKADPNSVELLLNGIKNLEIQYIPPRAANENIIKTMASFGIQVELFAQGNQLLKKYFVGGMTQDERGTYFLMDGSNQPFVMQISGFVGNLRERFRPELNRFRSQKILDIQPDKIEYVEVLYPGQPEHNFRIESGMTRYTLFLDTQPDGTKSMTADRGRVESFFTGLEKIACESFLTGDIRQDSVQAGIPFCTMEIGEKESRVQRVKFWQKLGPQNASQQGLHRFFILKDDEFMLGQYDVIKTAFRNGSYFIKK